MTWLEQWQHAYAANRALARQVRMAQAQGVSIDELTSGQVLERALAMRVVAFLDLATYHARPKRAAREAAARVRELLPYRFEGDGQQILSLEGCFRRGFGACGDGAAAVAGVFAGGIAPVRLCYETIDGHPQYAHARVLLGDVPVEPWPEVRRPEARGCSQIFEVDSP